MATTSPAMHAPVSSLTGSAPAETHAHPSGPVPRRLYPKFYSYAPRTGLAARCAHQLPSFDSPACSALDLFKLADSLVRSLDLKQCASVGKIAFSQKCSIPKLFCRKKNFTPPEVAV